MERKQILVDVDGVLLWWAHGFMQFMKNAYSLDLDIENHVFDIHKWIGWEKEVTRGIIDEFNERSWEFGCLPPLLDAQYYVKRLTDEGYRFVAITSCSSNPQTIALRRANLFHHFGDVFDAVHCVPLFESKEPQLGDYRPTFWIEDTPKNAEAGLKFGHHPLLIDRVASQGYSHPNVRRVQNWEEIYQIITQAKKDDS